MRDQFSTDIVTWRLTKTIVTIVTKTCIIDTTGF